MAKIWFSEEKVLCFLSFVSEGKGYLTLVQS